ncbi:unnamed protein product [Camellia sinensis]
MEVFYVEIISNETIKPSSPTPSHLKIFNLSLLDQITRPSYTPVTIFYSPIMSDDDTNLNVNQLLHKLKVSLSECLSIFYPLAGRIKDHLLVDCNDEGVLFSQAKVNCQLSEFLNPPDTSLLARLLPVVEISMERQNEAVLVAIQVNVFTCGGISIGLHFLHRIMDATTLQAFLSCWAATATGSSKDRETYPDINAALFFPPRRDSQTQDDQVTFSFKQKWFLNKDGVWKRFVFDAAAISALKAKVASEAVPNPTRFQVVASFIWKSAISASKALGSQKPSVIMFPVNMRPKMVPPMSQNSIGNIVWHATAHHREESVELRSTVDLLRGAIQKINGDHIQSLQGDQRFAIVSGTLDKLRNMYSDETPELYICITWCGLGFYDVDFGWGKPIWVTKPVEDKISTMYPNVIALMDSNSGGGIEAMMFLPETHMAKLLCDAEFLSFVSINPTISVPSAPN